MRPEAGAAGFCCNAGIGERFAELGMLGGSRIDEPAAPGGGGIQGDGQAIGMADFGAWQVGDAEREIGEAIRVTAGQCGGGPDAYGFLENSVDRRRRACQRIVINR